MATKRPQPASSTPGTSTHVVKRSRVEEGDDVDGNGGGGTAGNRSLVTISSSGSGSSSKDKGLVRSIERTSGLSDPILSLSGGHAGEILDVRFSNDGEHIAAAGGDGNICELRQRKRN